MTLKNLRRVAADSNVLLSAVIGGAALKILINPSVRAITTQFNLSEVIEYIPRLASKYHLDKESLFLQIKMLPLTIFSEDSYRQEMAHAHSLLKDRDPDDSHLAALALKEGVCIWSNDKDFEHLPMTVYTTAKLLKILETDLAEPA